MRRRRRKPRSVLYKLGVIGLVFNTALGFVHVRNCVVSGRPFYAFIALGHAQLALICHFLMRFEDPDDSFDNPWRLFWYSVTLFSGAMAAIGGAIVSSKPA